MARETPNWEVLLKWSLAHSDGTNSSRNLSEEDRRWFMEAMQAQTVDVVQRMKEITLVMKTPDDVLESQGVTPQDIEAMLDELQEHVESIDMANDLHSIGGLVPLLDYLKKPHANIRAKAAEVVSKIVQNNPKSQQLVMEANGLEQLLLNFSSDADVVVRTKALGAISSLIRFNKPGVAAFRLANGYAALRDALCSENVRFQRKALNLTNFLLGENQSDCGIVTELGFRRIFLHLASSEDADVREAALRSLLELAQYKSDKPAHNSSSSKEEEDKLKQVLQERIKGISAGTNLEKFFGGSGECGFGYKKKLYMYYKEKKIRQQRIFRRGGSGRIPCSPWIRPWISEMSAEDLGAAKEVRQLVDSLWNTCHDEPSPLRKNGLLVLPGEDGAGPPLDVASQHFEPPLRAWAAANRNRNPDTKPASEKKDVPPLLLGLGPPSGNNAS